MKSGALQKTALLLLAALLSGCAGGRLGQQTAKEKREAARKAEQEKEDRFAPLRLRQENLKSTLTDENGRPIWEATAKLIEVDDQTKTGKLEGAHFTFYDNGKAALEAKAPLVTANYAAKTVKLSGGVEGLSREGGYSFKAQQAEWEYGQKQVRASGRVTLWRDGWRAVGDELIGDTALTKIRLLGKPARLVVTQESK
jgi:LPS export ABC transporter protein LptC